MRGLLKDTFSPFWFDRSSPICDQIAILWHGAGNRELVTGQFGVLSGTTPPTLGVGDLARLGGGAENRVMTLNGSTSSATQSYIDLGSQTAHADIARGPCTFFACLSAVSPGPIMAHNDNNTVNAGWSFGLNTAVQVYFFFERGSQNGFMLASMLSAQGFSTSSAYPFFTMAVTFNGSLTAIGGTIYINGVPTTTQTLTQGAGVQGSDSARTLYIGGNDSGISGAISTVGGIEICAAWKRVLSHGEIASLHRDRLQLFRRSTRSRMTVAGLASAATTGPRIFVCT